ncbi:TetR/AcrR family transcriptional regulator [Skermania piniformis]|uniref:TetR/AcrR family transcriptional regulator n=2 Tax=Skermania pinensis TaxID=39122 RepID=A0ABX8SCJ1_9ACTN|nr:TetR/AcrR family transcriptional regulator [Skermania piniformis]
MPADQQETEPDSIESRILDAALVQFEKVGVKKTTIEDIARQAGVDRVTVYRRVGSRDDVVAAVVGRETSAVLVEIAGLTQRHDDIDDLVADIFVTVLTRWREHPLVNRMLALEPERVLIKLTTEGAPVFAMCVATTLAALQDAVRAGLLTDRTDLGTRAELLCRVVLGFVVGPAGIVSLETAAELDAFARAYLVPIVTG